MKWNSLQYKDYKNIFFSKPVCFDMYLLIKDCPYGGDTLLFYFDDCIKLTFCNNLNDGEMITSHLMYVCFSSCIIIYNFVSQFSFHYYWYCYNQKQSSGSVLQNWCSYKFCKIFKKTFPLKTSAEVQIYRVS